MRSDYLEEESERRNAGRGRVQNPDDEPGICANGQGQAESRTPLHQGQPKKKDWNLNKILFAIKKGSARDFDRWMQFRTKCGKLVEYKWWKKYGAECDYATLDTYTDYLRMCMRCGHNTKDPYWKYPKDINAAHEKVQAEYERVLEAERIARDKERARNSARKESSRNSPESS